MRIRPGAFAAGLCAVLIGCTASTNRGSQEVATADPPARPGADLVIRGGPILTMDPQHPQAEAIAITGDRIVAVGDDADIAAYEGSGTVVLDLGGAALLPGFVDAHSHFFAEPHKAGTDIEGVSDYILSLGITTTTEMAVDEGLLAELERIEAEGHLGVRVSAYLLANTGCGDPYDDWWAAHPPTREPGELLRIGGVKIFSDGGSCNTPAVSYSYADGGGMGDLYFTADELAELIARVEESGHQAAIHALGDRAIETVLATLERVIGDSDNPHRHRIEHTAVTRPDLRARHGEVGVVATIFGAYQTCFFTKQKGDFAFRTPEEYLEWEWPWRSLLDASPGAHFAWHADFPVFPSASPADALYGFVTRAQVADDGSICEPTESMAAGAITVEEALGLMTTGSAYALFRETEVGRLAPGMFADLVVLSADPTALPPDRLKDVEVWMTMVGGRVGWCADGHESVCPAPAAAPAVIPSRSESAPEPMGGNLAVGGTAIASAELPDQPATAAIDGDPDTNWGAGSGPPQWIEVDLGSVEEISELRLTVEQFPAGETHHRVLCSVDGSTFESLGELRGDTHGGQVLTMSLSAPTSIRTLRVETVDSPSWVGWDEIEVFR